MMPHIVVLGAGITGLSSALSLQSSGHTVTILAEHFPLPSEVATTSQHIDYTSPWGGAHNRWIPPPLGSAREHAWSVTTYHSMLALQRSNPEAGITFMKGVEYIEAPGVEYETLDEKRARELGMPGWRRLDAKEFPDEKVKWGCEYDTWCVSPMVYCAFLLRRFVYRGGKVVQRRFRDLEEVWTLRLEGGKVAAVVNASGIGFGDKDVFVTRGQTCLVTNLCDTTVTRQNADGTWTFCVPRNFEGGTIIGGTKEVDNWDPEPSLEVREQLLSKFAATYPKILGSRGEYKVVRDIVGRRPTRHGGPRVEAEEVKPGKVIVHAYGLGGRGYELSWGVAQEVQRLVEESLPSVSKL